MISYMFNHSEFFSQGIFEKTRVKIQGKINESLRTRRYWIKYRAQPRFQEFSTAIDSSFTYSDVRTGSFGITILTQDFNILGPIIANNPK